MGFGTRKNFVERLGLIHSLTNTNPVLTQHTHTHTHFCKIVVRVADIDWHHEFRLTVRICYCWRKYHAPVEV